MRHLGDEDIARLIDGKICKKERKRFLEHLADCDSCLAIYSETLDFMEEDRKSEPLLEFPAHEQKDFRYYWEMFLDLFKTKALIPVYAALLLAVVMMPFFLKENPQLEYLKKRDLKVDSDGIYSFSNSPNKNFAAVRAGIFIEDLSLLFGSGEEELGQEVVKMLSINMEIFESEFALPSGEPVNVNKRNYKIMVQRVREFLEKQALLELFQLGRFLERSILDSYDNKVPEKEDIERFLLIAQKPAYNLPRGIYKKLEKLKTNGDAVNIRGTCIAIEEIFLIFQWSEGEKK